MVLTPEWNFHVFPLKNLLNSDLNNVPKANRFELWGLVPISVTHNSATISHLSKIKPLRKGPGKWPLNGMLASECWGQTILEVFTLQSCSSERCVKISWVPSLISKVRWMTGLPLAKRCYSLCWYHQSHLWTSASPLVPMKIICLNFTFPDYRDSDSVGLGSIRYITHYVSSVSTWNALQWLFLLFLSPSWIQRNQWRTLRPWIIAVTLGGENLYPWMVRSPFKAC